MLLKKSETTTDTENQELTATHLFDELTVWGWDARPPPMNFDKLIAIQSALQKPI